MSEFDWLGTTDTDPTVVTNWDPEGVPGTGDDVDFDGDGDNPFTLVGNLALASLTSVVGYTTKLDLGDITATLMIDDGGDIILDQGGEFDCGDATISVTNATFDNKDVATYTKGTSEVVLNGTGQIIGNYVNPLYDLTFPVGCEITIHADTIARVVVAHTCEISGAVILDEALAVINDGDFVINSTAEVSGTAYLYVYGSNATHGLITFQPNATITATVQIHGGHADKVLAAGTYNGVFRVYASGSTNTTVRLNGDYTFADDVELKNTGTGTITFDNSAHDPNITIQGDLTWVNSGGGTVTYTKGAGAMVLEGIVNQALDFGGDASEDLEINKPTSGDVTLNNVDLTLVSSDMAGSLAVVSGDLDTETAATITIDGDLICDNNSFDWGDSTIWTVSGDCDYVDVTTVVPGTATLILDGTGDWIGKSETNLYNLTIVAGATITVPAGSGTYPYVQNALVVNGALLISTGKSPISASGTLAIGANGRIGGAGTLWISAPASGQGITSFASGGVIDVAALKISAASTGAVFAAGYYNSAVKISNSGATDGHFYLNAGGVYRFGSLELQSDNDAGPVILANANDSHGSITIDGDLTIDLDNAANIVIADLLAGYQDWYIGGDIINEITGGGTFTWTCTVLGSLTANGSGAQDWDTMGAVIPHIIIDKPSGTLTFSAACNSYGYTLKAGTVDLNGQTFTGGPWRMINDTVSGLGGSSITTTTTFRAGGVDMIGASGWTLDVTGKVEMRGLTVIHCNASGGSAVHAFACRDGGNNTNVVFATGRNRSRHHLLRTR